MNSKSEVQQVDYTDSRESLSLLEYGDVSYPSKQKDVKTFSNLRRVCAALALIGVCLLIGANTIGFEKRSANTINNNTCSQYDFKCQIDEAMSRFTKMQSRQSQTIQAATSHYQSRYGRPPPPGFDEWVSYALANNATIIDDYDRIEADLQPFRSLNLSKKQIYARMASAWEKNRFVAQPNQALGHITVKGGILHMGDHLIQEDFTNTVRKNLEPIVSKLPDLTILYNWYDEPRLILPSEEESGSNIVKWHDYSHKSTWNMLRKPCKKISQSTTPKYEFPLSKEKDICSMSSSQSNSHGFYVAPSNFHTTQDIFPMLSNAKVSTMGDILTPSPSYFTERYRMWSSNDDIPFAKKSKTVYWSGASTGMIMIHKHWTEGQRQRFVLQMKELEEGVIAAKEAQAGADIWPAWYRDTEAGSTLLHQMSVLPNNVSSVGFTAIFHCDHFSCDDIGNLVPQRQFESANKSFEHQIVADLDGEGMSGRFYRLVGSNSLPLKQTIWHEWHDERVLPWVHYVPLSLGMDELVPLLAWLLGTDEGQEYGALIANQGHLWAQLSLRQVDATIYTYRLLLEYARLLNEKE